MSREYLLRMLVEGLLGIKRDPEEAEEELAREEEGTLDLGDLVEMVPADDEEEEEDDEYENEEVFDRPARPGIVLGPEAQIKVSSRGSEMLYVAQVLRRWLARAPDGPLELGNLESGRVLAALVFCWSSTAIHMLASRPMTFDELDAAIPTVSRQVLAEQVQMLVAAGLVEPGEDENDRELYSVTDWLRESVAPLAAAARWERHFPQADTLPPDSLDVGAAFLMTLPLLRLPEDLKGWCRLGVYVNTGSSDDLVGVTAQVEGGQVVAIEEGLDHPSHANATGTVLDWLDTLVDPSLSQIQTSGRASLADELVAALHETLFPEPPQ